jgi:hypothetical protein
MTHDELWRRGWDYDEHGWWGNGTVEPQFTITQAALIEDVIDNRLLQFIIWMQNVSEGHVINELAAWTENGSFINQFYASREKKNDA